MKSKFKKLWYDGGQEFGFVREKKTGDNVAICQTRSDGQFITIPDPETDKYGHLFAAAPEMYDALVAIHRATTMGQTVTEDEMFELHKQILAALAKADGGEYR